MKTALTIAAAVLVVSHAFGDYTELVKQGDAYDAQFKPDAALQY